MCEAYVSEGSFTIDGIVPINTKSDGATETETSGSQERERAQQPGATDLHHVRHLGADARSSAPLLQA